MAREMSKHVFGKHMQNR